MKHQFLLTALFLLPASSVVAADGPTTPADRRGNRDPDGRS